MFVEYMSWYPIIPSLSLARSLSLTSSVALFSLDLSPQIHWGTRWTIQRSGEARGKREGEKKEREEGVGREDLQH